MLGPTLFDMALAEDFVWNNLRKIINSSELT
jgi:hypothetical protein